MDNSIDTGPAVLFALLVHQAVPGVQAAEAAGGADEVSGREERARALHAGAFPADVDAQQPRLAPAGDGIVLRGPN